MNRVRLFVSALVVAMSVLSAGVSAQTHALRHEQLFPAFAGGVPVLLYHRVTAAASDAVSPTVFAAQMQRLHELGFETITIDQYVRFVRGDKRVDVPPRPILITFDDATSSVLQSAGPILERYGWTAVLYVPTGLVGSPGRLTWRELRRMQAGAWQIDEHAGDGHVFVRVDAQGRRGPYYANEVWAGGAQETFTHYRLRVSSDIARGAAQLAQALPGWRSHGTFAIPYGDYGNHRSNDSRIKAWLSSYLRAHFVVTFVEGDDTFTTPHQAFANRIGVSRNMAPRALEQRLLDGLSTPGLRRP
jgi:peptidoglycan/xylan/chitin deacetylase (PgdA/CDA1 family)